MSAALLHALESIGEICNETRVARDLQPAMTEIRGIARAAVADARRPDYRAALTQLCFVIRTSGTKRPELLAACEKAETLITEWSPR